VESITAGRADYDLEPFFYTPLHDVDAVRYRHAVLRDLEKDAVFEAVRAFAQQMRSMRGAPRTSRQAALQVPEATLVPGRGRDLLPGRRRPGRRAGRPGPGVERPCGLPRLRGRLHPVRSVHGACLPGAGARRRPRNGAVFDPYQRQPRQGRQVPGPSRLQPGGRADLREIPAGSRAGPPGQAPTGST
jgi:hypothetical protein